MGWDICATRIFRHFCFALFSMASLEVGCLFLKIQNRLDIHASSLINEVASHEETFIDLH